jgi:hypothetical protein
MVVVVVVAEEMMAAIIVIAVEAEAETLRRKDIKPALLVINMKMIDSTVNHFFLPALFMVSLPDNRKDCLIQKNNELF